MKTKWDILNFLCWSPPVERLLINFACNEVINCKSASEGSFISLIVFSYLFAFISSLGRELISGESDFHPLDIPALWADSYAHPLYCKSAVYLLSLFFFKIYCLRVSYVNVMCFNQIHPIPCLPNLLICCYHFFLPTLWRSFKIPTESSYGTSYM